MDKTMLSRVDAWLAAHRAEIIEDLIGLVRIPSVSVPDETCPPFGPHCRAALQYMFDLGQKHGYAHRNYENYVGQIEFSAGTQTVGIWAHLDVVPVPDSSQWDYPPFEGTLVADRYLIGRGVQDNKAPAIGVFHVMNCLRDLGVSLRHGYSLYMGTNEEVGMADVRYFTAHYPCPTLSLVPDCGFPVCVGQRGAFTWELSVPFAPNVTIHQGNDPSVTPEMMELTTPDGQTRQIRGDSTFVYAAEKADNAILRLLDTLIALYPADAAPVRALRMLCSAWDGSSMQVAYSDEISGALCMAPTIVKAQGGHLSVRVYGILPVTMDGDAAQQTAQALAEARGVAFTPVRLRKPCRFPEDHPLVGKLTRVYQDVSGLDGGPYVMSGGNYAAYLPNALGYGPGMPGRQYPPEIFRPGHGNYHQCDESEDIEHLLNFMRIYAMTILALEEEDVSVQTK